MTPQPDAGGHFGPYGGRFVPEVLMAPLEELEKAYLEARDDSGISGRAGRPAAQLRRPPHAALLRQAAQREARRRAHLAQARRPAAHRRAQNQQLPGPGAARPAHGQAPHHRRNRRGPARRRHRHRLRAVRLDCVVYMGEEDMRRQRLNVFRMRLLGAKVVGVTNGSRTLKDAISEAMRDWVTNVADTHYLLGSALGAHPYPDDGARFSSRDRRRSAAQILEAEGRLPDTIFACVGGGSNAIGIFHAFLPRRDGETDRRRSRRTQREARRARRALPRRRSRRAARRRTAICCRMTHGQVSLTHSVSAGLDYAMIGPEHAWLHDQQSRRIRGRVRRRSARGGRQLSRTEGIIPALESAHARRRSHSPRAAAPRARSSSSMSPAAATRTSTSTAKTSRNSTSHDAHRQAVRQLEARRTARA